jgi:predicted O-methyltransferase YrrM
LGSQTGLEAVLMGKIIGKKGKLFIFEPYSASYKIVVKNMQINGLLDASQIFKMGAGKAKETLKLWIDK